MEKFCQSCGMPMEKDPQLGGTEKSGEKSEMYCSHCYEDGEFTAPHITNAKEMQAFCIDIMKKQGWNSILAWIFTRSIPRLKRWKK